MLLGLSVCFLKILFADNFFPKFSVSFQIFITNPFLLIKCLIFEVNYFYFYSQGIFSFSYFAFAYLSQDKVKSSGGVASHYIFFVIVTILHITSRAPLFAFTFERVLFAFRYREPQCDELFQLPPACKHWPENFATFNLFFEIAMSVCF